MAKWLDLFNIALYKNHSLKKYRPLTTHFALGILRELDFPATRTAALEKQKVTIQSFHK